MLDTTSETTPETTELETATGGEGTNSEQDEFEQGVTSLDEPTDTADAETEETEATEGESAGEGEHPTEAEFATIEIDGAEYEVPVALKDGYMKSADYTQKSQANAELRRQLEAREQEIQLKQQVSDDELNARASLQAVDAQLATYQGLTNDEWAAIEQDDPMAAQSHWRQYQMLKDQKNELTGYVSQVQHAREQEQQSEMTKRLEATEKYAKEEIKGWTQDTHAKIVDFAERELSLTKDILRRDITPQMYKALHLAWVGQQSLANRAAATPANAKLKPLTRVSAKSSGSSNGDPSSMGMDEYAKWASAKYKD